MKLTNQDKLALALTSAGSMRNLAALVGVSHQKIGRWLREGHPDGAKAIPTEATEAIDLAFRIHKDLTKQTARAQGLPYDPVAPTFMERKPLRTGELGDRVFAEHTRFIRSGLRQEVIFGAQQSRRFISASVRSTVDINQYARRAAQVDIATRRRTDTNLAKLTREIQAGIERKLQRELRAGVSLQPLFTKYSSIAPNMGDSPVGVDSVEKKLRAKHEPATLLIDKGKEQKIRGTALADQYLFQLLPAKRNATPSTTKAKTSTRSRPRTVQGKPGRGK